MYDGYVQQLGTPSEVYNTPANVFVAKFIGSPAMNVLPATIATKGKQAYACFEDGNGASIQLKLSQAAHSMTDGQSVLLGIRPEAISDPSNEDRKSQNSQPLKTTVMVTEPSGADTFVTLNLAGIDVVSRLRGDVSLQSGEQASFVVNMDKVVLFDPVTEKRRISEFKVCNRDDMEFDYIVIGGGSAGCVVASRLSENPALSILLVEAGSQDTHPFIICLLALLK